MDRAFVDGGQRTCLRACRRHAGGAGALGGHLGVGEAQLQPLDATGLRYLLKQARARGGEAQGAALAVQRGGEHGAARPCGVHGPRRFALHRGGRLGRQIDVGLQLGGGVGVQKRPPGEGLGGGNGVGVVLGAGAGGLEALFGQCAVLDAARHIEPRGKGGGRLGKRAVGLGLKARCCALTCRIRGGLRGRLVCGGAILGKPAVNKPPPVTSCAAS